MNTLYLFLHFIKKKILMNKIISSFILGFLSLIASSQNYELDAIRFSTNNFLGTARFVAVGGAFSSVGADFSNLSYNPAGIGMYRNSTLVLTPGFNINHSKSEYRDSESKANQNKFLVPNIGGVFATTKTGGTIQSAAFGIGLNRMADYNRRQSFSGFNDNSGNSITNIWVEDANLNSIFSPGVVDVNFDGFSTNAFNAYEAYLLNIDFDNNTWRSPVEDSITQRRSISALGGKQELVLSGGANYLDKLYFGATIGIPILRYESTTRFIEEDVFDVNENFDDLELIETYETKGAGINLKAGFIYRINNNLRIGGAFHSPERLSLTERFSNLTIASVFNEDDQVFGVYQSPLFEGEFDYTLRTPWRANIGASFFLNQSGFLSVDYEVVDYTSIRYDFGANFEDISAGINDSIQNNYKIAHNIRVGLEGVIDNFRLRAGYNYIGSPLKNNLQDETHNYVHHRISGGFGVVSNRIAFDLTVQHGFTKEFELPYQLESQNVAPIRRNISNTIVLATLGFRINR